MSISQVQHKLGESLREIAVWKKRLKSSSKGERQVLRALSYLADLRYGEVGPPTGLYLRVGRAKKLIPDSPRERRNFSAERFFPRKGGNREMNPMLLLRRLIALIALTALFSCSPASAPDRVVLTQADDRVDIAIDGKPFSTYYFVPESPKPYLHPLRAASGAVVTRGFPMKTDIEGESTDHPHHRALYFAHGDISGVDFWHEGEPEGRKVETAAGKQYVEEGRPRGKTSFQELLSATSGADTGELSARFHLVAPDGKVLGSETQKFVFHADDQGRTIDCEFTIKATSGPVKLGDTKEGTFAIRVVHSLRESEGAVMLSSEGGRGEEEIWGKRAEWVDYSGTVEGESLGIAIFDHPRNPKHPTYWMARGYGLFAANPFGEHHFYKDPSRDGSLTIPEGEALTLRYRVVIHSGNASEAGIAERYKSYQESIP